MNTTVAMSVSETYFGLPVSSEEAFRLLGLLHQYNPENNSRTHINTVNQHLSEKNIQMRLYPTDKGQFVLGYIVHDAHDVWRDMVTASQYINTLVFMQSLFYYECNTLHIPLTNVFIQPMEDDTMMVERAEPFIITW